MKEFLLIRLGAIGDIVLATAAIEAISKAEPESQIDFVCKARFAGLLEGHPKLANVYGLDEAGRHKGLRGLLLFINSLNDKAYNAIIDLQNNTRSRIIAMCLNGGKKIHWPKDTWRRRALVWGLSKNQDYQPVIARYLRAVSRIGIDTEGSFPKLYTVKDDSLALPKEQFIAIAPGAHWPTKRWPTEHYATMIGRLADWQTGICIVGDKGDMAIADEITKAANAQVSNLCGKLDLSQLTYVLSQARLLVTNDTGAMHIAEAAGTPVVAIFGPTVRQFGFAPWRKESRIIEAELDCRPCALHGSNKCPRSHFDCMNRITAEQVLRHCDFNNTQSR